MKFILPVILISAGALTSQESKTEIAAVQNALSSSIHSLSAGEFVKARNLATADYQLLEQGEVWNLEQDLAASKATFDRGVRRVDQLEFKTTRITDNSAFVVYLLTSQITENGVTKTRRWLESAFLIKKANFWRISLVHSTELAPPRVDLPK